MTRRCSHCKISQLQQGAMFWIANDDMVKDFDFDKLAGADEVAGHFDVGFRRLRFATRMIVL